MRRRPATECCGIRICVSPCSRKYILRTALQSSSFTWLKLQFPNAPSSLKRGRPPSFRHKENRLKRGFYTIMAAQFLSSLADNALLIAAIALLASLGAPEWQTPLLKLFFVVSYVLLAAWVGIFADSMPKGRVMFLTNFLKAVGCLLMLFGGHTLLSALALPPIPPPNTAFSRNCFLPKNWSSPMAGLKGSRSDPSFSASYWAAC